jgi:hypothetical protein
MYTALPPPPRAHSFTTDRIDPQWMYRFVCRYSDCSNVTSAHRYTARPTRLANPRRYHMDTRRIYTDC